MKNTKKNTKKINQKKVAKKASTQVTAAATQPVQTAAVSTSHTEITGTERPFSPTVLKKVDLFFLVVGNKMDSWGKFITMSREELGRYLQNKGLLKPLIHEAKAKVEMPVAA